jgi:hypothetical protein
MFVSLKNKVQNGLGVTFWWFYLIFDGFKNDVKNTTHWSYLDS